MISLDHVIYAGFWGGIAGLIYVYYNKYIHPTSLSITSSAEGLLGVIAGGSGTLVGPIVGSVLVTFLKNYASILHRSLEHAARVRLYVHSDSHARWHCAGHLSARGPLEGAPQVTAQNDIYALEIVG